MVKILIGNNIFKQNDNFSFFKSVLVLALPVAGQRIVGVAVNLIDNLMVGSLGDIAVSACSVANQYFLLYTFVISGLIGGMTLISAQAWGNKNVFICKKMISLSLILCGITAVIFTFLTLLNTEFIVQIYTDSKALLLPTTSYLTILTWSFLPFAITTALTMLYRTVGNVKIGFYVECLNSILNAIFNYTLIYGNFGFPSLGLEGAAIATVLARCVGLIITVIYVFIVERNVCYRLKDILIQPNHELLITYLKYGIPILFGDVFMMVNSTLQTMITGRISEAYIAANSIVHVIWQIAMLTAMGFETAANIMIGNSSGEGNLKKAQKDGERFFILSIIQGIVASVIVFFIGPYVISLYNISQNTLDVALSMVYSATFVVFMMSIQMITTKGVIRAGGKSKEIMILDITSSLCFGIPLGFMAAFIFKLPPWIIYILIRSDYLVKSIFGIYKLIKKNWIVRLIQDN